MMQQNDNKIDCSEVATELDDISVAFSGKYSLVITNDILQSMKRNEKINITWSTDKQNIKKDNVIFCLNEDLVRVNILY